MNKRITLFSLRRCIVFSSELDHFIKERNYYLTRSDYLKISPDTCPQIDHMKYDPFRDIFEIWTNDGYHWEIKVILQV